MVVISNAAGYGVVINERSIHGLFLGYLNAIGANGPVWVSGGEIVDFYKLPRWAGTAIASKARARAGMPPLCQVQILRTHRKGSRAGDEGRRAVSTRTGRGFSTIRGVYLIAPVRDSFTGVWFAQTPRSPAT